MARFPLRFVALVALMAAILLAKVNLALAQANDPFGMPPAAPGAAPVKPTAPAKLDDPFGAISRGAPAAPPAVTPPGAAKVERSESAPARRAGDVLDASANAGLRKQCVAEVKIARELESKTECDFTETPLADVIEYFENRHKIHIELDLKALQDEAIDSSVPVTRSLKDINLKSALRLILREHNLAYVIRNEVLLVTTKTEEEAFTETRVYPVQDLLSRWPNGRVTVGDLIQTITASVHPTNWEAGGQIMPLSGTLVIDQTQAMHEEIADLLASLRHAKKQQLAEKAAARAERTGAGDGPAVNDLMRIAVYGVPRCYGDGLKSAIIALIAPKTWKDNGGEGTIQLVRGTSRDSRSGEEEKKEAAAQPEGASGGSVPKSVKSERTATGGFGSAPDPDQRAELLIVRQTDEVHEAIEDLLHGVSAAVVGVVPVSGGTAGGGFFNLRP